LALEKKKKKGGGGGEDKWAKKWMRINGIEKIQNLIENGKVECGM